MILNLFYFILDVFFFMFVFHLSVVSALLIFFHFSSMFVLCESFNCFSVFFNQFPNFPFLDT